jgi:phosphatidylserine/phosphatidylglycerophosphate/cardiolipin synthase-like enzyme
VNLADDPIATVGPLDPSVDLELKLKFASHHQKVLLVRGESGLIGFCGGVDIFKDRVIEIRQGSPQHDVHCQMEGPAAHLLVDVFAQRWHAHPGHEEIDNTKGRLMGLADRSPRNRPKKGDQFVRIARTVNFVDDQPAISSCQGEHSVRTMMLAVIRNAKYFVYIEDQYLALEEAAEELKRKISTLQHVTVVVPHPQLEPLFSFRRRKFLQTLRSAPGGADKVRAFHAVSDGQGALGRFSYIHAKTWIVDDEVAVIGSANCNNRGWSYDSEVVAAIVDRDPRAPGTSFAQKLRMQLWSIHLGVPQAEVVAGWGEKTNDLWTRLPLSSKDARVRVYDEKAEAKDYSRYQNLIDPAADFPVCDGQWLRQQSIVSREG